MDILYVDEDQKALNEIKQNRGCSDGEGSVNVSTRKSIIRALNDLGIDDFDTVVIGSNGSSMQELKKKSKTLIDFLEEYGFNYKYYIESDTEQEHVINKNNTPPSELVHCLLNNHSD